MQTTKRFACHPTLLGVLAAVALAAVPLSSSAQPLDNYPAYDIRGLSRPSDALDWNNPAGSLPRGGDSDVMTVYQSGQIFAQAFAFGNEENNNVYYFDPTVVRPDSNMYGKYTTLLEPDGSWSDTFGVARFYGVPGQVLGMSWDFTGPSIPFFYALAFMSDSQNNIPPTLDFFSEQPGMTNPVPEPGSDSRYLTVPYDATSYLDPAFRAVGYTADFRSDVPEPASLSLLGLGLAGLFATRRRSA